MLEKTKQNADHAGGNSTTSWETPVLQHSVISLNACRVGPSERVGLMANGSVMTDPLRVTSSAEGGVLVVPLGGVRVVSSWSH